MPENDSGGDIMDGLPGGGDAFTETTSRSWLEKIVSSLKAIIIGLLLVIVAGVLLFWNEGRSARTSAALSEGSRSVVSISTDRIDAANDGKLIHVAGNTIVGAPARDTDLNFEANGLRLKRKVEMYQWKEESQSETQKKLGGGEETVTRYTYKKEWSDRAIDSSRFRNVQDHRNPPMPATGARTFYAADAKLGAFRLEEPVLQAIPGGDRFAVPDSAAAQVRSRLGPSARILQGDVYVGADPNQPSVGDVRMMWEVLPVMPVSVVGRQSQSTIKPWVAGNGNEVLLVEAGAVEPATMFRHGQESNEVLTWVLRLVGALLMFIGFRLMLSLLEALADVVPFFGNIAGAGASLMALLATMLVAPLLVALAWFFYRPLVAAGVLIAGAAIVYGLRRLMQARAAQTAPAARPLPGAPRG